jgi:hypothetical protein
MTPSNPQVRAAAQRWVSLLACVLAACSAKHMVDRVAGESASDAGSGGVAGAAVRGQGGGMSGSSSSEAGSSAGGGVAVGGSPSEVGGSPSEAGASEVAGAASECGTDADCADAGPCVEVSCDAGACRQRNVVRGTLVAKDEPANCQAARCDGLGRVVEVVELTNAPAAASACAIGICDQQGNPQAISSPAGVACKLGQGPGVCDGAGGCVECLTAGDCAAGACVKHACVQSSCTNGKQDGSETAIDCGGSCPLCADGVSCKIDQDCASDACEPVLQVCLPASCVDQQKDNSETDVDCGGGDCSPCYITKKCLVNADCATNRCDPGFVCGGEPCADHRLDGNESDIDCGGLYCRGCRPGERCNSGFDCRSGTYCDKSKSPQVCAAF